MGPAHLLAVEECNRREGSSIGLQPGRQAISRWCAACDLQLECIGGSSSERAIGRPAIEQSLPAGQEPVEALLRGGHGGGRSRLAGSSQTLRSEDGSRIDEALLFRKRVVIATEGGMV